ncbi:hypothetical protein ACFL6Z_02220 [Pseudomonadota bacterium]
MNRVTEFKSALDIANIFFWMVILLSTSGLIFIATDSNNSFWFIAAAASAILLWLTKVLALGVGYSLCSIAENTAKLASNEDHTSSAETTPKELEYQASVNSDIPNKVKENDTEQGLCIECGKVNTSHKFGNEFTCPACKELFK